MLKDRFSTLAALGLWIGAGLGTGCSQLPSPAGCPRCGEPDSSAVRKAYARSLRAARYPKPRKIDNDLVALVPANDDLSWNKDGKVLMVTWTKAKYYQDESTFATGKTFPLAVESWFTAAPFVQRFCRGLELEKPQLIQRLQQRIGLPPTNSNDSFLEVWVDPADLFRPCPDPEVTDDRCQLEVYQHGEGDRARKRHRLPWACDPTRARAEEKAADPEHFRWLCENWKSSFRNDDTFRNYPWTALGYTYDWGAPDNPRGASEFVAPRGSEVVFHSLTSTAEYCRNGASTS